jgi:hypothetical protein
MGRNVPQGVKSVQRGTVSTLSPFGGPYTGTVTINAVNLSKAVLIITGTAASSIVTLPLVQLTNATTITWTVVNTGSAVNLYFAWQVVEYY